MFSWLKRLFGKGSRTADAPVAPTLAAPSALPPPLPAEAGVPPTAPSAPIARPVPPPGPPVWTPPPAPKPPPVRVPEGPTVQLIFADGTVESVIPQGEEAEELRYLVDNLLSRRDDGP